MGEPFLCLYTCIFFLLNLHFSNSNSNSPPFYPKKRAFSFGGPKKEATFKITDKLLYTLFCQIKGKRAPRTTHTVVVEHSQCDNSLGTNDGFLLVVCNFPSKTFLTTCVVQNEGISKRSAYKCRADQALFFFVFRGRMVVKNAIKLKII